jgi:hypothetical protein
MRAVLNAALVMALALGPAMAASHDHPASPVSAFGKTGKERLSDKGSDEQRVDDCEVPLSTADPSQTDGPSLGHGTRT